MGHILLASPAIEHFHLHEQLGRRLMRRGHRVTLLTTDPVTWRCFDVHGLPARLLVPARAEDPAGLPLAELAARDARLQGPFPPDLRRLRRLRRRLARRTTPLLRMFESEIPDLVVVPHGRAGLHRLIDAVARGYGCPVTHLGDGLLPGTIQHDGEGIDGDSSASRRSAGDYRHARADRALCDMALVGILAEVEAPPVARRFVHPPDPLDAIACLAGVRSRVAWTVTRDRLRAWRTESERAPARREPHSARLPAEPFVALLMQRPDDQRVLIDCDDRAPGALELATALRRAVQVVDRGLRAVAIAPGSTPDATLARLRKDGFDVRTPRDAALAAATAAAVVTVNHPLAMAGVIAGTPVLHLGRALYGVPGIATRTTIDQLRDHLATALAAASNPTLRARFTTQLLSRDHLWCDPAAPDPNGLRGLVAHLEGILRRTTPEPEPTPYQPGPGWPLRATEA